jgi:DnaK suppressor protein
MAKKITPAKKKPAVKKAVKKAAPVKAKKAAPKPAAKKVIKKAAPVKSAKKVVNAQVKKTAKKIVKAAEKKPELMKPLKAVVAHKLTPQKKAPVAAKPKVEEAVAKPKSKVPLKKYSKTELEHFKKIITEKQREIIEQLQNLRDQMLDPTTGEYINENSPYSLHMAEQGTDAMEREKTYLYAQRENKFLGYLEDALKRIEMGTYGLCIDCIDDPKHLCPTCPLIPKERLEAVPHSQLCVQIKMKQEKPRRV